MLNCLLRVKVQKLAKSYGVRYSFANGLNHVVTHLKGSNNEAS